MKKVVIVLICIGTFLINTSLISMEDKKKEKKALLELQQKDIQKKLQQVALAQQEENARKQSSPLRRVKEQKNISPRFAREENLKPEDLMRRKNTQESERK